MKKFLLCVILTVCITGVSLFAWEAQDLTKFPPSMDGKTWIFNLGVGFSLPDAYFGQNNYIWIPPIRLSFDKNTPIGAKNLPFFFGGLVGYSGYGFTDGWFLHRITAGVRAGYHFNFNVENLDVYAVTTAGWTFYAGNGRPTGLDSFGIPSFGVNLGGRWFVSKGFGFWAEAGYSSYSFIELGLAFKF